MTAYNAGGTIPSATVTTTSHGRCPLDGYPLAEIHDVPEGGWDHILPLVGYDEARLRVAEVHGFEASAAAEQIVREA